MRSFARLFVVALAGTRVADTKFVRGTVDTIQAWKYITRFCFTPLPHKARDATEERALKKYGRFDFEVRFPNGARPILALHYNGFNNWDKVYKTDDSCFARINKPGPHMQPKVIELCSCRGAEGRQHLGEFASGERGFLILSKWRQPRCGRCGAESP